MTSLDLDNLSSKMQRDIFIREILNQLKEDTDSEIALIANNVFNDINDVESSVRDLKLAVLDKSNSTTQRKESLQRLIGIFYRQY
ncbi:MAG: hypothetical protein CMB80_01160 [Flammeovirgaceae bacterium]|nr:hypothetical protein [Flammeovirgaceae bacterium]